MFEEFPYVDNGLFDARTERVVQKREQFLVRTLQNFFDYVAALVKQPKESLDFSDIEPELKRKALDRFLLQQHPGFSNEERMELRETLLQMF